MTEPATTPSFGVLTLSLRRSGQDPALHLEDDLALAAHADRLGLDEIWWRERHGRPGVVDPLLMVAHAAATTRRIRLGAAVSPACHHPVTLADSALQLDHLTRGRFALGLATEMADDDMAALGLGVDEAELTITETVSATARQLRGSRTRLGPYRGGLDVRTVSRGLSIGPELAGSLGLGLVSSGAAATVGPSRENRMTQAWQRAGRTAVDAGRTPSRSRWAVVTPIHIAVSQIEARRQVPGIVRWAADERGALPDGIPTSGDADTLVDAVHASGHGVIGTPDMAIDHIERMLDLSGGVGAVLIEVGGWADAEHTSASLELLAREVIPQLTGAARLRPAVAETSPRRVGRRAAAASAASAASASVAGVAGPLPTPARGVTRVHDAPPLVGDGSNEVTRRRGRHAIDPGSQ